MRVVGVAMVALLAAGPAAAQTPEPDLEQLREAIDAVRAAGAGTDDDVAARVDSFQLFTECRPVQIFFREFSGGGEEGIGLTLDRLNTMVEARLRAARLYPEWLRLDPQIVIVTMALPGVSNVSGAAYIAVEFWKHIYDPTSACEGLTFAPSEFGHAFR